MIFACAGLILVHGQAQVTQLCQLEAQLATLASALPSASAKPVHAKTMVNVGLKRVCCSRMPRTLLWFAIVPVVNSRWC